MAQQLIREAVGVFHESRSFEAAIDELLMAGFDRSLLSLMATAETVERKLGHLYERAEDLADDPLVPRTAFIGHRSRTVLRDAAAAGLAYVGAVAAAGAVVASGGTFAFAIAAAAAAGGAGGAVGLLFGNVLQSRNAHHLAAQLDHGGILLWVRTVAPNWEEKAVAILNRHGATGVHIHDLPEAGEHSKIGVSSDLAWINKPLSAVFNGSSATNARQH